LLAIPIPLWEGVCNVNGLYNRMSGVCVYVEMGAREVIEYGDWLHATEVPTSERWIGRTKV
jgi:hypothetical protein